jgi:hypothetical protein
MIIRRAVYLAQFVLAVVLPVWILVSRGIVADGLGWQFVAYLVACPVLFVALAAIAGIVSARKSVRAARAVSWLDAGLLGGLWVLLVLHGLFAIPLLAALIVILVIATFWVVSWELFDETRTRVKSFLDLGPYGPPLQGAKPTPDFVQQGSTIIVPPPGIGQSR